MPKTERLEIRISPEQKALWKQLANSAGLSIPDWLETNLQDAERYRWLCDGNGYFLEEEALCGYRNEKEKADKRIDEEMRRTCTER